MPVSLDQVRATLQGPVTDIFCKIIPELGRLPRTQAYDRIMDAPELLDGCFRIWRTRPALFAPVATARDGTPAQRDEQILPCGMALGEVIALVVRAAGKRHFRKALPLRKVRSRPLVARRPPSLTERFLVAIGWHAPPPRPKRRKRRSPGDELFAAMRHLLRFEWQVLLLPHYVPLPPALVQQMGERLLDYRTPEALAELARQSQAAPAIRSSSPVAAAWAAPSARGPETTARPTATLQTEAMWAACQRFGGPEVFGLADEASLRTVIAHASRPNPLVLRAILDVPGFTPPMASLLLCMIATRLGPSGFRRALGEEAGPHLLSALEALLRYEPIEDVKEAGEILTLLDRLAAGFVHHVSASGEAPDVT